MIGEAPAPEWLETRTILAAFGETEPEAVAHYARFVAEGKGQPAPWEQLKNQVFLGSDSFVESLRRQLPNEPRLARGPTVQAPASRQAVTRVCARLPATQRRHRRRLPQRGLYAAVTLETSSAYTIRV